MRMCSSKMEPSRAESRCSRYAMAAFWLTALTTFQGSLTAQEPRVDEVESLDLWEASQHGDLIEISRCLAGGAEINRTDPQHEIPPLGWAAARGHVDAVDLLLDQGADIEARTGDGATALHVACFFGEAEVAERLLDRGADIDAQTDDGATPLGVLKAEWELTRGIANQLEIEWDQNRVAAGRTRIGGQLRQRGANEGENPMFAFAIVAACVLFGLSIAGLVLWFTHQYEKRRTEAMQGVAEKLGLSFSAAKDEMLLEKLQRFAVFSKGHSRKMKNVMTAETELAQLTIFDYRYTVGYGKHSRTHNHTMVAMEAKSLRLPEFTLRPQGFFDKVGAALGFQDINFDDHPEFSRLFVLKGKDESAIRGFFDPEMCELFAQRKGMTIDCGPDLFVYMQGGRKKPEEIQGFMSEGYEVFQAFEQRSQGDTRPTS